MYGNVLEWFEFLLCIGFYYLRLHWNLTGKEEVSYFVVEDKDKGTPGSTENVGEGTLEECLSALVLGYLPPAIKCSLVSFLSLSPAGLHHDTTPDGVEGIGDDTGDGGDGLGNHEGDDEGRVSGVREHALGRVEESKVGSSVDDNTLNGDTEPAVEPNEPVRLEDLRETVPETTELSLSSSLTNVGSQSSTGKVEWVDEAETRRSCSTTGSQVTNKVSHELSVLVNSTQKHLLVLVLEGEVEGLSREVPDDIGHVTSPERKDTLLLGNSDEAVNHTLVPLFDGNLF